MNPNSPIQSGTSALDWVSCRSQHSGHPHRIHLPAPIHGQKPIYNIIVIRQRPVWCGKRVHQIDHAIRVLITVYAIVDELIVSTGCTVLLLQP